MLLFSATDHFPKATSFQVYFILKHVQLHISSVCVKKNVSSLQEFVVCGITGFEWLESMSMFFYLICFVDEKIHIKP